MADHPALVRRLGLGDATVLGLGSMLGAGVFAAFTPAAQAAGSGLLVGLVVAGLVAFANATSSAQLAAVYPTSGGTYVYGRARLGPVWGFLAGWSFVIGKTASCAAMAIVFAAYAAPVGWERPVAILAVVALATVNLFGITRTALLTRVIVVIVLAVLAFVVALGATTGLPNLDLGPGLADDLIAAGPYGVLQSAGLLFFAFAGYARIATLGEEVRDPARTIPRAIVLALSIVLVIYAIIAVIVLGVLGPEGVAAASAPLSAVVEASGFGSLAPVVRAGAAAASLGALLALIAGIGRTTLAMARERDLPPWLAAVHPRTHVPHRAEVVLAVLVCAVIAVVDLRGAIGFSSFGVLLYYAIANAAALTQHREQRLFPRWLAWLGVAGCLVLVFALPWPSIAIGVGILAVGIVIRALSQRAAATNQSVDT